MFIWTIGTVIETVVIAVILISIIYIHTREWIKKKRCKHTKFYENSACHAICRDCRLDLGFVKNSRDDPKREECR